MLKFCIIILFSAGLVFPQVQNDFARLFYLEGSWIIKNEKADIHEIWERRNASLLTAVSFYLANGDTTNVETIELKIIDGSIHYIPVVQHNAGAVYFKASVLNDSIAVFENPEHDFPTKIIYRKINGDSLHARIEGIKNGKLKGIDYYFRRENE